MKKVLFTLAAILGLSLALVATSCGGGGGGSDDDDETPVAGSGSTGTGSGSSESGSGSISSGLGSGSESTGGSGSGGGSSELGAGNRGSGGGSGSSSTSVPEDFVLVPRATFDGATGITDSEVFIKGRTVTIPSLWACDHEVTQAEYQAVMGENPSYYSGLNKPVENVSWFDALVYCNKRSIAEELTPCYTINGKTDPDEWGTVPTSQITPWNSATCDFTANGYRLPTEAEWEYLARGGNLTNIGQTTYSGDNEIESVAWYAKNAGDMDWRIPDSGYGTHEIKTKDPNGLNLYDMSGNVKEWCWEWYGIITTSTPSTGSVVPQSNVRIQRGGSWIQEAFRCSVSSRNCVGPYDRGSNYGFRVVCTRSE